MAKVPARTFLLLRRAYKAAADNVVGVQKTVASAAAMRKAVESNREAPPTAEEKHVFWMRDPKTGNWVPETHFNEVDVAELREKLLPNINKAK